jgi:hypothetical protein
VRERKTDSKIYILPLGCKPNSLTESILIIICIIFKVRTTDVFILKTGFLSEACGNQKKEKATKQGSLTISLDPNNILALSSSCGDVPSSAEPLFTFICNFCLMA